VRSRPAAEPLAAQLVRPEHHAALAVALGQWLPTRRWFAGKAREVVSVTVRDTVVLGTAVVDVVAEVAYASGDAEQYQVPLAGAAGKGHGVMRLGDVRVMDALDDECACRELAAATLRADHLPTSDGNEVVGRPVESLTADRLGPARPLGVEQSNSSVVFGDELILKVFRKLEPGTNPDVELTRALTEARFPHVPAQRGALDLARGSAPPMTLAVLSDFAAGAREAWALALDEVGAASADVGVARADVPGGGLSGRITQLGAVVAELHAALADRFGRRPATPEDVGGWVADMQQQLLRVAETAQRAGAAEAVQRRVADIRDRFDALTLVGDAGPIIRIHGDLHLGQVLLDERGRWLVLDFEGEPARPMEERRRPASALRDVAGMLRSFDYAAATGSSAAARTWLDEVRWRFLEGYLPPARRSGILPPQDAVDVLLAAFELDKAVYELGYELANRPSWAPIPVGGILRVLEYARGG
jgi:maltokinase